MDQFACRMRSAAPGIVVNFDSSKQTVTVQLVIKELIVIDNTKQWRTIPVLVDVPVFMPRSGNFILTMPVTAGDECLVIFGDNCMDAWWQSGGVQNQAEIRRHDLSDGFALLGVWSQPNVVAGYSTDSAVLRSLDNTVYVKAKGAEVDVVAPTIKAAASVAAEVQAPAISAIAAATAVVTAPAITLTGAVIINGDLQLNGALGCTGGTSATVSLGGTVTITNNPTIAGRSFTGHTHSDPQGGNTGGVN
jgi:hypothetical protein